MQNAILLSKLSEEEDKNKQMDKGKSRLMSQMQEIEEHLQKERGIRADVEKARRKLEVLSGKILFNTPRPIFQVEMNELREQMEEKRNMLEDLQLQLKKKDEELQGVC